MANITASQVNELRKATGAGMMDCKKALVETDGDMEQAIDILRKKGQKIAAKRGDNEAKEGLVFALTSNDGKTGIILAFNCETDFVAKNSDFYNFVESLATIALDKLPENVDALKALPYNDKLSVEEKIVEQVGVVGEKLQLSKYKKLSADKVVAYIHPGNQLATLVAFNKSTDGLDEAGKQVAMQVAAMNPVAINKDGVSKDIIEKELEVGKELAIQEGKPAELAEKIAHGRLNKFFKENTLLSQQFISDNKLSVEQYLKNVDKELSVSEFERISLN